MKATATDVLTQFRMQAPHYHRPLQVTAITGARTALVVESFSGKQYHAWFCVHSHEYWLARVHLQPVDIDLVVCQLHTTCLPVETFSLSEGSMTPAKGVPHPFSLARFTTRERRSTLEMWTFIGLLACGDREAYECFSQLHKSSKCRYRQRLQWLSRRKRGNQTMRHQQGA